MPKRFITYSRTQPARTIIATVSVLTFLASLFIFTPWFIPLATTPAAAAAFNWPIYLGAILNAVACIPAMVGIKKNTPRALSLGAFWLFIWYLFVTITRLVTGAALGLTWITTLIVCLVMATLYLEQGAQARRDRE